MAITIDGQQYKVLEDLGFQHSSGYYVKEVDTEHGPRMAVKDGRYWRFWTNFERSHPLIKSLSKKSKQNKI